ncbi:hypothetical protein Tco_1453835 [Tanacetum coccineum]
MPLFSLLPFPVILRKRWREILLLRQWNLVRKRATSLPLIQPRSESFRNQIDLFAFIRHEDPTKVRYMIDDQARSVVRVSHGDQNDNIKNFGHDDPNEESGDADQEDRSKGNDHVGQDETSTILVDTEVQVATADKPKGKRKKRRATGGASGYNLPLKRLRKDYGTSSNVSASIGGKSLAAI